MGKNKGLKTFAGITLGLIGGFFAANMAAIAASAARNVKKAEKNESENNQIYAFFLQNEEFDVKPETQNAYLTFLSSKSTVNIPRPEKGVMNVEIFSFIGKLNISLPGGVKVNCEGSNHLRFSEGDIYKVTDEYNAETILLEGEQDDTPVINLIVNDHLTALTIESAE
ncbi:MAG: hypothetical protein K5871_03080 [Lachnospiraceae bacterium]|nr:hypothetical protein [Lachnospiraceae bacterium]